MVKSVVKALDILELVQKQGGELSTSEIARLLGYEVTTAHNLVRTLASRDYLTQPAGSRSYRLGTGLMKLLDGSLIEDELNRRLTPLALKLSREMNENVVVSTFRNNKWRRIVRIDSSRAVTVNSDTLKHPFYSYASGRLLLTQMDEAELISLFSENGNPGEEWPEVATFDDLKTEVESLRESGYAVVHSPAGITAISTLIEVDFTDCPLALSIFLPTSRCDSSRKNTLIENLLEYRTLMIEQALGTNTKKAISL